MLYRAKIKNSRRKNFIYGSIIEDKWFSYLIKRSINPSGDEYFSSLAIEVIPETVGISLDINDVDGIQIFQGDIVTDINYGGYAEVKWSKEYLCWVLFYSETEWFYLADYMNQIRVIGNMFDNSELMKLNYEEDEI